MDSKKLEVVYHEIASGNLREAILLFRKITSKKEVIKELLTLEFRLSDLDRKVRTGQLDHENEGLIKNSICLALIELLEKSSVSMNNNNGQKNEQSNNNEIKVNIKHSRNINLGHIDTGGGDLYISDTNDS